MKVRIALLILGLSTPALAYLDPVTGGAFIQILLVIFTSIALGFHRLKLWILGLFGKAPEPQVTEQGVTNEPTATEASAVGASENERPVSV